MVKKQGPVAQGRLPERGRCICGHDRSRHNAGTQECRFAVCYCPFFRQEDEISIGLQDGSLRIDWEVRRGGIPTGKHLDHELLATAGSASASEPPAHDAAAHEKCRADDCDFAALVEKVFPKADIFSRPECPFNYCDQEGGGICKEKGRCRHAAAPAASEKEGAP